MRISLNGPVIPDAWDWLYTFLKEDHICPKAIRQAIRDTPDGEALELEINSGGGDVFAGFEAYSLLREAKCPTVGIVQSLAASSAANILAGCQTVQMSPVAQIMIHLPATGTEGNQVAHRESAAMLESITQSILNAYEIKVQGKTTRSKLRTMMDRTTWMSAQDAVDVGLADEVLYQDEPLPGNVVNCISGAIRTALTNSSAGALDYSAMLAQYEDAVRSGKTEAIPGHPVSDTPKAPTEPTPTTDDWQATARLNIEKNRFLEV